MSQNKNPFQHTGFLRGVPDTGHLPPDHSREAAFAGRSNAGKSSALNAITGQSALARTSKTPGRTQMLNFFQVRPDRFLVDLPGYGYARVSERVRRGWQRHLRDYLQQRRSLQGLVLLMDIRHPLTSLDRQLISWCAQAHLPMHILLTKADKLGRGQAADTLQKVRRSLVEMDAEASLQLFSATRRQGLEEVRARLAEWLELHS